MGKRIYLNNGWLFCEKYEKEMIDNDFDDSNMEKIRLPHTCKETPYHYFDEHIYQMVSAYRKKLDIPEDWQGKCVMLTLEGVAHESEVFLNGEKIGEHHCGYTAFSIDLSKKLNYGRENVLTVKVDSRETNNIPPLGYVIDYMTYGGIYRDVYLDVKDENHLQDVFLYSEISGDSKNPAIELVSQIQIKGKENDLLLCQMIRKKGAEDYELLGKVRAADQQPDIKTRWKPENIQLWDIDDPVLYEIKTQLLKQDTVLDENVTVFGFRKAEFLKDGFYLNGRKVKIRGLNRHQSYPYVGYAMPKFMQYMDADILKRELGVNAVRTSHYPQSHYFLERCDEIGLLVFTEMPGWQHIGDEAWKMQAVENTRDMVVQYRNHPSIILWGVRINESQDDDAFYQRTNEVARELDPSRQTGGVRAHKKSSFLEDVYTYNDFIHDGRKPGCEPKGEVTPDCERPYLVTEYNGHMYPTKAFDWEEHRVEHAVRHANVLNAVAGEDDISGSFGWCMADYNTHKDFGSGDRICYHGVLDMFRNPKLAADVYASQQEARPVFSVGSSMDKGEHPGAVRGKIWVFTNADSVRMYMNDQFVKEYYGKDSCYQNLPHGPILIDELYNKYISEWGKRSITYRFEAIKDNKVIQTVVKEPMTGMQLKIETDHTDLVEEHSYDVAAVRICMLDENGNLLNFFNEPILLKTEGPVEIIGEPVISFKGGMAGVYLKTTGSEGRAALIINSAQAKEIRQEFNVSII